MYKHKNIEDKPQLWQKKIFQKMLSISLTRNSKKTPFLEAPFGKPKKTWKQIERHTTFLDSKTQYPEDVSFPQVIL